MELRSGPLTLDVIRAEVHQVVDWLQQRQIRDLSVMYGVGCDLENEDLWTLISVETDAIAGSIAEAEARGFFALGQSDLFIYDTATIVPVSKHRFEVRQDTPTTVLLQTARAVTRMVRELPGATRRFQRWNG